MWSDVEWMNRLARWEAMKLGHFRFDDETATRSEVCCRVAEAVNLLLLCPQVPDRVEREIDHSSVGSDLRRGHVAHGERNVFGALLLPQLRKHRFGEIDSMHWSHGLGQRQRQAPCADRELHGRSRTSEVSEELHGWPHGFRRELVGVGVVIDSSDRSREMGIGPGEVIR